MFHLFLLFFFFLQESGFWSGTLDVFFFFFAATNSYIWCLSEPEPDDISCSPVPSEVPGAMQWLHTGGLGTQELGTGPNMPNSALPVNPAVNLAMCKENMTLASFA